LALGLIGGGGSILTVPVLVYLFSVQPVVATAYSLFIVGLTSAVGTVFLKGLVNIKTAIVLVFHLLFLFLLQGINRSAIPKEIYYGKLYAD
jgi:uncharacterized membrane protein YfcA